VVEPYALSTEIQMWNGTDIPLAIFITFRTYGSWLHGDERGSVNRFRNKFGTKYLPPEKKWLKVNRDRLNHRPVVLDGIQRKCVEAAVRETCRKRHWILLAINVRTNHVHIVVSIQETTPSAALNAFKANATRVMREHGRWNQKSSPWVDKGSTRYLWNEKSVEQAIHYVRFGQGDERPTFDRD
jgi:REP element-mobilizing transposase RayT